MNHPNLRGVSWWVPDLTAPGQFLIQLALVVVLAGAFPLLRFYTRRRRASCWAAGAAFLLAGSVTGHLLDTVTSRATTDWIRVLNLPAFDLADL